MTARSDYVQDGRVAIIDEQNIVYRKAVSKLGDREGAVASGAPDAPGAPQLIAPTYGSQRLRVTHRSTEDGSEAFVHNGSGVQTAAARLTGVDV